MGDYAKFIAEDRRLVILRLLSYEGDYALNDSVVQTALEQVGHGVSRDVVRSDFSWLKEQDLITVEIVHKKIHVAKLTNRGNDVSHGRASCPGVKRPSPEDE
jgi:hypothetical protein